MQRLKRTLLILEKKGDIGKNGEGVIGAAEPGFDHVIARLLVMAVDQAGRNQNRQGGKACQEEEQQYGFPERGHE